MTKRKLRYTGLGLAALTLGAIAACSSTDNTTTPGGTAGSGTAGAHTTAGAGGTPGVAGASTAGTSAAGTGTAGTGTAGTGGGGSGFACAATAPTAALITDFSNLTPNATSAGNYTFMGGVLGGTFTYQPNALTLDTVGNTAMNIKGNVKAYDGFGLYFNTCYDAATAGYTGISFSVKGYVGPKGKLNFRVQTNANTLIDTPNMKGQCVSTAADTYMDCHNSSFDVPVTSTATVITVNFSQLTGGAPMDAVTGKDIVGLEWALDWTPGATGTAGAGAGGASGGSGGASGGSGGASGGSGGASGGSAGKGGASAGAGGGSAGAAPAAGPYDADVTIDDVKFIGGPPSGGAGAGAGGGSSAGAGGASAGAGGSSAGAGGSSAGAGGSSAGSAGKGGSN